MYRDTTVGQHSQRSSDECPEGNHNSRTTDTTGRDGRRSSNGRGLSDVLGYVIIFSIVVLSITLLVLSGMASLEETREDERIANAERAFDVIADNMQSLYERNAPSRATEIDLGESEIFYANNVSITVLDEGGDGEVLASTQLRPIELRVSSDESLVYEGGAVFRAGEEGGVMLREPPFLLDSQRVHVPLIQTTAPAIESAGSTTILLRGESTDRITHVTGDSHDDIAIEIASPRYEIWEGHLERSESMTCTTTDESETVQCVTEDSHDTVFVTEQRIELSLIL